MPVPPRPGGPAGPEPADEGLEPAEPQSERELEPADQQPGIAGSPAPRTSRRGIGRLSPERISAYAAVAGVVVAGMGVWLGTRGDPSPPSTETQTTASQAGRLGPVVVTSEEEVLTASGTYEGLHQGHTVVFMVQPADHDMRDDPWITLFAQRTPTQADDGGESGNWLTRMPLTDPRQDWRHVAAIAPEVGQGVAESDVLSRLSAEGPESSLLSGVTNVMVYEPEQ